MRKSFRYLFCVIITLFTLISSAFATETIKGNDIILSGQLTSQNHNYQVKGAAYAYSSYHRCTSAEYRSSSAYQPWITIYNFNEIHLNESGFTQCFNPGDISQSGNVLSRSYSTTYYPNSSVSYNSSLCRYCSSRYSEDYANPGTAVTGTFSQQYLNITKTWDNVTLKNCTSQNFTLSASKAVTINGGNYQGSPAVNSGNGGDKILGCGFLLM